MTERIVTCNGIQICTESFGDPAAPPLLLIMGLGAQMIVWDDAFCAMLAAQGFHVVRFDNRDCGRSQSIDQGGIPNVLALLGDLTLGRLPQAPYLLSDMARDAVGVMDASGFQTAHVVGASMGGMIAQVMAIEHPRRLRSLTSIMSTTGDRRLSQATPEAAAVLVTPAPLHRDGYIQHAAAVAHVLRGPHFAEDASGDAARAARAFDRGINLTGTARQFAAVLASGDRTTALQRISTRALVIHGDADPLVRIDAGKATAAAIPNAKLQIMPRMGHTLPQALWPDLTRAITTHARTTDAPAR